MFKLVQNNQVIFEADRKIDVIYEHQKYKRRDKVKLVEPKISRG